MYNVSGFKKWQVDKREIQSIKVEEMLCFYL